MSGGSSTGEAREARFRRLIEIGTAVLSELDLEAVLVSVVDAARELTGARYAALGVLDRNRDELERFIHRGIDPDVEREIGDLPRGRGVLGELIREPTTLRLRDVNQHPHAYGFPPGHPPMHSFLGVPIKVRGEAFGNLYMTEKRNAEEFSEADAEAAETLAIWAGIAIENARLYTELAAREAELQIALRQAETSVDIARTVGGETDVERVLDLIVKRARALVDARVVVVLLRRGEQVVLAARAGQVGDELDDLSLSAGEVAEDALRERLGAVSALVVPLVFRGHAVGDLVAFDREAGGTDFDREDERLLQAFAASAATAVATAQMVESERLRQQVEIGERERGRWAQELHDDTLQNLAAIRISLATALQTDAEDRAVRLERVAEETIERLELQVGELNRLIDDLRPAALERLGLAGALEAMAGEYAARGGFEVEVRVDLAGELGRDEERALYRLAQEALNNVAKHAGASRVTLEAERSGDAIRLAIVDDGGGFESADAADGRGLAGMRERAESLGGRIEVDSRPAGGTRVLARLPLRGPPGAA